MAKRWNECVTDERILAIFQDLKDEMGISTRISLYQNSDMSSPVMYGFVKPRIILPTVTPAEDELRFILKHELVHYKRKDLCFKFLVLVATAIHWFNPIAHLVAKVIRTQCEVSCDAEVIRDTDSVTRLQYSEALIGVVKYHSKLNPALSTNFYGGKKGMKKRITSIMDTSKKRVGGLVVALALVATLGTGFAFATNALAATSPTPPASGAELIAATGIPESRWEDVERGAIRDADARFPQEFNIIAHELQTGVVVIAPEDAEIMWEPAEYGLGRFDSSFDNEPGFSPATLDATFESIAPLQILLNKRFHTTP